MNLTQVGGKEMEKNRTNISRANNFKYRKLVYYIFGALEILLAFRLVFKVLGANPGSNFVSLIYTVSGVFLAPFRDVFRIAVSEGIETKSVLEPTTIISMIVYAIIAYAIVRLIEINKAPKDKEIQ
jgi:hypothetical protein